MINKLADIPLGPFRGFGPLGLEGKDVGAAPGIFNQFISSTVGVISIIAFVWFIFLLVSGAYGIMGSGADKEKIQSSRARITNAIIGIVVLVAALFIIDIIGSLIGIPNILNPAELIQKIGPK